MKICSKCNAKHEKSGKYCCRSCANSRVFSEAALEKKRNKSLNFWSQFDKLGRKEQSKEKMLKYDRELADKRRSETLLQQSRSRPYEEMSHGALRKRMLVERNFICEGCGIGNEYNGKPLTLELDHYDGNNQNNKYENLRILCPNCHSQTPTYRGKNTKLKRLLENAPIV